MPQAGAITQFPAFDERHGTLTKLNYFTWNGQFCPITRIRGIPGKVDPKLVGPAILYRSNSSSSGKVVVISPMDNFMTAVQAVTNSVWAFGIGGEVAYLPSGFSHATMLYVG